MGNSGGRDRARQAAIAETARRNATSDANQERFRTGYDESYAGGKDERSNLLNAIYGGINGGRRWRGWTNPRCSIKDR